MSRNLSRGSDPGWLTHIVTPVKAAAVWSRSLLQSQNVPEKLWFQENVRAHTCVCVCVRSCSTAALLFCPLGSGWGLLTSRDCHLSFLLQEWAMFMLGNCRPHSCYLPSFISDQERSTLIVAAVQGPLLRIGKQEGLLIQ